MDSVAPDLAAHARLRQAQQAVKHGRFLQARHLLYQLVQEDPQNFRAWLWLAYVAPNPAASRHCLQQATRLNPAHPALPKARQWLAQRQQTAVSPPALKPPQPISPHRLPLPTAIFLLLFIFAGTVYLGWAILQATGDPATALAAPLTAISSPTMAPTFTVTAVPTATNLPPTATTGSTETPLPTSTPTATPTITPSPTPTLAPTFVGLNDALNGKRPLDVGPSDRWIDIDLGTQRLTAYEGDTAVFTTLISSGLPDHPTVTGQFRIWHRMTSQTMDGRRLGYDYYLENVPHVMYFYEDYAIHGAYWHNNFGQPMSHGCVNTSLPDARWLFDWASYGTAVSIHP